ncbi:MAG: sodium:proton antiporter [Thermoleophilia bacterium]|nr:sodium:proton antiporter [Thermoleophilia bacterium]
MTESLGESLGLWMVVPFAGMLLSIAVLPLVAGHWFEHARHQAQVAAVFGIPVLVYLVGRFGGEGLELVLRTGEEYVSFIVLLAALFTVSGGIYLTGNLLGTPLSNVAFLLVGAVLANFIGTTGAAMVLIRPLLRANSERKYRTHVVIFAIFVICNVGGLLTPLGDPPLFLGFLRGVDFFWTLRLLPQWAMGVGLTVLVFMVVDTTLYRREPAKMRRADIADYVPLGIAGKVNVLFLAGIIGAVLLSKPLAEVGDFIRFPFVRELAMVAMLILSLKVGPHGTRMANHFSWGPITEVAIVFAGIFAAMIPALAILEARGSELGLTEPWQFFWVTGALSSFLDNAPTYLTFTSTAQGYLGVHGLPALMGTELVANAGASPSAFLAAISTGAVFMGANSYIGNAPNFMVRSIAESSGVKMPSFFGYMAYSAGVLIPIFFVVTLVFFI